MDMVIGWGILAGLVIIFAAVLKFAGPPGDAKPHCGLKEGGGSGGACCH